MRNKPRKGSIYRERGRLVLRLTIDGSVGPQRVRHGTYPDSPEGWEDADRDRRILVGAEAAGSLQAPSQLSVGDYLESWIESLEYDVRMGNLRPGTAHHYAIDMRAKVIPRIGQIALTDLTSKMLRRLYSDLLDSGGRSGKPLSGKSVRNVGTILRRALRDAVADDLLKSNPADGVKLPKVGKSKIQTWTPEQTRHALDGLAEPLRSMVHLTATTGMRRSEVLGLRWSSVDFEAHALDVTATLVLVGTVPTFSELTKTKSSRRRIALDPATVETLKAHRVVQLKHRLAAGELWTDPHGLVFTDEIGDYFSPSRYTRMFQSEAQRLGLPPIGVHGLRHSLATTALADGVPVKVVADRLGHSSVATTLDRYSHVSEEQDRAAAVHLAERIAGA
jgi:integrase